MLEYCKTCLMYSAEFNELRKAGEDTSEKERNYCPMYENGIPKEIESNKKDCKYHEAK